MLGTSKNIKIWYARGFTAALDFREWQHDRFTHRFFKDCPSRRAWFSMGWADAKVTHPDGRSHDNTASWAEKEVWKAASQNHDPRVMNLEEV